MDGDRAGAKAEEARGRELRRAELRRGEAAVKPWIVTGDGWPPCWPCIADDWLASIG